MLRKYLLKMGFLGFFVTALLFIQILTVSAEEISLPVLNTKAKTVIIFKNGLGFFIREGEVTLKDGWGVTEYVPNSSLGSIWIGSLDKDAKLEEAIGFKQKIKKEVEAISIQELFKPNIGKKVIITLHNETIIEGKIKSVPENRKLEEEPPANYDYVRRKSQIESATIVIIETKEGEVILKKSNISKIEFPDGYSSNYISKGIAKRIKFKISDHKEKAKLSLSYLQKGIGWIPSYLVNIEDSEKARITMKTTIINDIEDLENTNVFFVVGYPNFKYSDILSPMALEQSLSQLISSLEQGDKRGIGGALANIMTQRVAFEKLEKEGMIPSLDFGYSAIQELSGIFEEDLFFYDKKAINLKKGERAYYHIFSKEVDYKHVYEWRIPNTINIDASGFRSSSYKSEEVKEQVWHSIKLTNSTDYPWTTAPAFTVSSWKPLAQDIISYTPKGSTTNLKLTVSPDIETDRHENEVARERNIKLYGYSHDLVTVEGELNIKNLKDKEVIIEIKKMLTGEVLETSHNGKIKKIAEGLKGVNYNSIISWEILLKPEEETELTYKYKVYIRR
ncbi:MAG: hypothetical protein H8D22_02215 [Candidatus Cloacimonetes bacterium]|nr:hypothetical protein [Candidatus Cloacimonadota bacterium]